jgi:hypothetical protein
MPHATRNESEKSCIWIVVHSSGGDQGGIESLPKLDAMLAQRTNAIGVDRKSSVYQPNVVFDS